ncbi:MAG: protein-disulfide reductase DsbD [Proteobacteria bacterium]|nr:MAG: protein-disulfide reductase DsbD [Pseudomonadota bacterium]
MFTERINLMLKRVCKFILGLLFIAQACAMDSLVDAQAFALKIESQNHNYMWVKFNIADGYHLYQSKIKIVSAEDSDVKLGVPVLPDAKIVPNDDHNLTAIYENSVAIQVPIIDYASGKLTLDINYQGCKGNSLCLPEQHQHEKIDLNSGVVSNTASPVTNPMVNDNVSVSITDSGYNYFMQSSWLVIVSFFSLGLLIAFTPCVFPLLPVLIGIVAGNNISTKRSFILALSYILGGAVVYAIAGVLAAVIGHSVSAWFQGVWISVFLALLFAIFALSLFGWFELRIPVVIQQRLNNSVNNKRSGSILGSFIIGGLSNLILSPCVTAPLAGALVYISTTGDKLLGGFALFALGFGSGIPLLIIAVFGKRFLPKSGNWMLVTKQMLGLIMLAMAAYMISKIVSGYDDLIIIIFTSISLIILGGNIDKLRQPKVAKILIGIVVLTALGLYKYRSDQTMHLVDEQFVTVTTVSELEQKLHEAQLKHQPVILDFYANWCSACKELDLRTFSDPAIQNHFRKYAMIRVNVTQNTPDIQIMQQRYGIFALPTLLMLDSSGRPIQNLQTYGFINRNELLPKLEQFEKVQQSLQCGTSTC